MRIQNAALLLLIILTGCASQSPTLAPADPDANTLPTETTQTGGIGGVDTPEGSTAESISELDARANKVLTPTTKLALSRLYFEDRNLTKSQLLLESINILELNANQQQAMGLLAVELYLQLNDQQAALHWLIGPYAYVFENLDIPKRIKVALWRAEAWELNGQFLAAAQTRIDIANLLSGVEYGQNHDIIWSDLQFVEVDRLLQLASHPNPILSGWAGLAYASASSDRDLQLQIASIKLWQRSHPDHPAALLLPGGLDLLTALALSRPDHIGLLLPLSGSLQQTGEAIRDGFLAAYYDTMAQDQDMPVVTFVDTTKLSSIQDGYEQLVISGAKLVIGPLTKQHVRDLQEYRNLRIPVLALNTSDTDMPFNGTFYQFGLNPEDEAIEVARRARRLHYNTAAILVPIGNWGERVSQAFKTEFTRVGGHVVTQVDYANTVNRELLQVVQTLLNLDNSVSRTAIIERVIGENVEYDARRRKDIDFIFMAAVPTDARQIKPLLNFQFASTIPVLATSTVYAGKHDPDADKNLEDVQFVDMPWQLQSIALKAQISDSLGPNALGPYSRLFALGADAFQLYPRLKQFNQNTATRVHGYTGILSMDSQGRLVRELEWALIDRGIATPMIAEDESWLP